MTMADHDDALLMASSWPDAVYTINTFGDECEVIVTRLK